MTPADKASLLCEYSFAHVFASSMDVLLDDAIVARFEKVGQANSKLYGPSKRLAILHLRVSVYR
jgi:hypothetical protein